MSVTKIYYQTRRNTKLLSVNPATGKVQPNRKKKLAKHVTDQAKRRVP